MQIAVMALGALTVLHFAVRVGLYLLQQHSDDLQ